MNLPRLSPSSARVMAAAAKESAALGQAYLGVEHLFLGLASESREPMSRAFSAQGQDLDGLLELLRQNASHRGDSPAGETLTYTIRGREVLALAGRIASRDGQNLVQPVHILESIFHEGRSVPLRLLRASGVDLVELQQALAGSRERPTRPTGPTPLLQQLGRDLTALAEAGQLSPLIGREPELGLLAQVLLRRNKNNPVLVGEAGVGKTAVVEGFAQSLVSASCPEPLRGRRIVEVSFAAVVAGTKYRGEFEDRLMKLIKELADHPEIILFVDELHTVVGAGSTGGDSLDASNILKPALARGEIRCIGATTVEEYRRYVEKDAALERRFDKILIDEPTPGEAVEILSGVRPVLEAHHDVVITPETIRAAVELTTAHVADRQLPDKALDALDQSCARRRLEAYRSDDPATIEVTEEDVTKTVSTWTGVPLERATPEAARALLNLADRLKQRVIGQDHAVEAVSRAIVTARAGLAPPRRPVGVFFFLGPTGVGKTELARSLAEELFDDPKGLVRFDMSEYTEEHSVAKLIGAPPGYVGYEREGLLISALRTRPHRVVLFDEVEKAHPRVLDIFLQVFDEGRLSGAHGRTADFTQAVVILTSNINLSPEPRRPLGFVKQEPPGAPPVTDARAALAIYLRPELVNRIDEVVVFRNLERADLRSIIDRYIREIEGLLASRRLTLRLDDGVYDRLLEWGSSSLFGARELRRVVDRHLRQPLAQQILERDDAAGEIHVTAEADRLKFD